MSQQSPTAGLPPEALTRLHEMASTGSRPLFTSDLSVNEFLLVKESGFDPVGLVVGSSIYHIGFQAGKWGQSQEMTVLTQAMYQARELAMTRMEEEADALGADGVVGVRLDIKFYEWNTDLAEFIAIGTAVKSKSGGQWRSVTNKPFTSDLSGQDFWTLLQAGYAPLGLVMGTCVYHVGHQSIGKWFSNIGKNTEMANFTQALYEARELAMERMQTEADELKAEGIVGVSITEANHSWGAHTTEFLAVGTAVKPLRADHEIAKPSLIMTLDR
jgi:uncharacterized protein YbjQ (UPF0145 family)